MTVHQIVRWIGSPISLIVHSILFASAPLFVIFHVAPFETVLLVWNTAVSLEAIYLSLFIQMSVNNSADTLSEIEKDIDDIAEEVVDEDDREEAQEEPVS